MADVGEPGARFLHLRAPGALEPAEKRTFPYTQARCGQSQARTMGLSWMRYTPSTVFASMFTQGEHGISQAAKMRKRPTEARKVGTMYCQMR